METDRRPTDLCPRPTRRNRFQTRDPEFGFWIGIRKPNSSFSNVRPARARSSDFDPIPTPLNANAGHYARFRTSRREATCLFCDCSRVWLMPVGTTYPVKR